MTDRDILYLYRLRQAEETLSEAEKMLGENFTPRSITKPCILYNVLRSAGSLPENRYQH